MNKIYDVRLYEIYEMKLLLDIQSNGITRATFKLQIVYFETLAQSQNFIKHISLYQ